MLWKWGSVSVSAEGQGEVQGCAWHGVGPAQLSPAPALLRLQATQFRRQSLRLEAHQGRGNGRESQASLIKC